MSKRRADVVSKTWSLVRGPVVSFCLGLLVFCSSELRAAASTNLLHAGNSTLRMPAQTAQDLSYQLVDAFPGLSFDLPVGLANPPDDTNRLFVVERTGRIVVITNLANPTRSIFLDISDRVYSDWTTGKVEGLSSVAFHPGYLTNRFPYFYVSYTLHTDGPDGLDNYNRISRFQSSRATPNEASSTTELPLITQIDHGAGHNINDLLFGPDGYLYAAVGDEGDGGTGDDYNNAQKIDKNFFSAIMRIDVDQLPENLAPNPHPASTPNYSIPADNPWVGATNFNGKAVDPTQVRTEFYAVGLRNPWRMSYDPFSGMLIAGDVGQHTHEEIDLIVKGGNYGWSLMEGTARGPKGPPPAGLALLPPLHEYSPGYGPDQGFSVIGGVIYRGQRLPELYGAYLFADYVSGNIWALRWDDAGGTSVQRLSSHPGIAGFGTDPRDGEVILIDHDGGKLLRLEPAGSAGEPPVPPTLADTGVFSDLQTLTPNPGIVPYEVNAPFWSDGAQKQRWFSLPDPHQTIGFNAQNNWTLPSGAVWIKHFELTNAAPLAAGPRRVETRVLVKTDVGVYGVTYRWDSATNATLVPTEGMDEPISVLDASGIIRTQVWHYPSRSECIACHTPVGGSALGFNTAQLNRDVANGGLATNQLRALSDAGYFQTPVAHLAGLPALSPVTDERISRPYRVRSYLAANCAQCHQPGGPAHAQWDARVTTPLATTGIINGSLYDLEGDDANRVVVPGDLAHSMLFTRIGQLGKNHMPPIGSGVLDTNAMELVREWITIDVPSVRTFPDWQLVNFGTTNLPAASLEADPDGDGASNELEFLTGTNPQDAREYWRFALSRGAGGIQISFPQVPDIGFVVETATDLSVPTNWEPLDVPENRLQFLAAPQTTTVFDNLTGAVTRFYRVRIVGP